MIESLIDLYKDMEYKNPKGTKMLLVLVIASTLCIVYIFASGIGGIVSNIFAPRITYIGQIEKIQVEEGQVSLTVKSLAGEDKGDWLNNLLPVQRPSWTNVKYPEEIEGKMKKYFKDIFTLEVDGELEYEVGDKVKIVGKNFKIKSISKANEHVIENATIPIVTGIVEKYKRKEQR
ncbi:hypothetical protein [Caldisalinibacter kiritimatiensis]|uniref:Uncharacterized protein n=1 Tax=Caldisalinibacter kiritimatiensis TaxID=1304284 RepID=R1AWB7_9FIRM|nr:hypothetical protein [Caldisalinibacter kiritimatiensis]EOD01453.1 hypothetical protein L21TH_0500 [Caldisalinibacter kiritimatiensis]